MRNPIRIDDKEFESYVSEAEIQAAIKEVAQRINADYAQRNPLLVAVLNGSFVFAADLMRNLSIDCEISFVKLASYHGISSTGSVHELIGLTESTEGRDVLIVEDIVDTGLTIEKITTLLTGRGCRSVKVVSLLFKPDAYLGKIKIDYAAMQIPNRFIVGYGLDYNGKGRNLRDIYQLKLPEQ